MEYSLGEFIRDLNNKCKYEQGLRETNIQNDLALETINECLPRNMMVKKIFLEEKEGESVMDIA